VGRKRLGCGERPLGRGVTPSCGVLAEQCAWNQWSDSVVPWFGSSLILDGGIRLRAELQPLKQGSERQPQRARSTHALYKSLYQLHARPSSRNSLDALRHRAELLGMYYGTPPARRVLGRLWPFTYLRSSELPTSAATDGGGPVSSRHALRQSGCIAAEAVHPAAALPGPLPGPYPHRAARSPREHSGSGSRDCRPPGELCSVSRDSRGRERQQQASRLELLVNQSWLPDGLSLRL